MSDLPTIHTAYDMKAIVILSACDIMQNLIEMGDHAGAHALRALVETVETIPTDTGGKSDG